MCETQICLLDLLPSKMNSIVGDHEKGFVSRVERMSSSILLDLALNLHILISLVQLQFQLEMNNMHHRVSLQLHVSPTQPLGLTTISSPCEPHYSSTSILRLPLLRKCIQQVWHLWNTTSTSGLDRWTLFSNLWNWFHSTNYWNEQVWENWVPWSPLDGILVLLIPSNLLLH
jgi:hypothetical protein